MAEFLHNIMLMPTLVYTALLGLIMLYWCFVFIGLADMEALDTGDSIDGFLDGAAEGAAEATAEAVAEVAAEAAAEAGAEILAEGVLEGAADAVPDSLAETLGDIEGDSVGQSVGLISSLKLRSVPLTVSMSLVILFSWVSSYLMQSFAAPLIPLHDFVVGSLIFALSLVVGMLAASIMVRPFEGKFETHQGQKRIEFIGESATVITLGIDANFGEIRFKGRSGVSIIQQARCDAPNDLQQGDEVLIISQDKERKAFVVEPMHSKVAQAVQRKIQALRNKRKTKH